MVVLTEKQCLISLSIHFILVIFISGVYIQLFTFWRIWGILLYILAFANLLKEKCLDFFLFTLDMATRKFLNVTFLDILCVFMCIYTSVLGCPNIGQWVYFNCQKNLNYTFICETKNWLINHFFKFLCTVDIYLRGQICFLKMAKISYEVMCHKITKEKNIRQK